MRAREVLDHLRERRAELVGFLERLARAESPVADPAAQDEVLGVLCGALEALGFAVRRTGRSRRHLYARPARRERGAPVQLLLGHCDTVWPLGTVEEMPVEIADGVVRGPGVYDMKGGLAQTIFALRALEELELEPQLSPAVFINSDEERGSRESGRYIRMLARLAERVFVMEPSLGPSGKLKTARKGLGRFSVVVEGEAAHAGLEPEGGASAILELTYVVQALFALNEPARGVTVNVGTIDGGLSPNVVAPRCTAQVDVRVPTREDALRVEKEILSLQPFTPGVKLTISGRMGRPPMERTPRNRALWEAARRLGAGIGLELEEAMAGGGSDGNTTSQYTATLDGLGAVGDGAHARHEFVYVDAMVERCALLVLLMMEPPLGCGERRRT